ncbi:flippase-like domain-containing protein [bacterium]|nr:flippase-like domain-containing protein [bacterium]
MKLKVFIGILISVVFIYLSFRSVDLGEMWETMKAAKYAWLLPAFLLMLLSHLVRAYRSRYFIEPIKKVPTHPLFSALMIGYASNNILPLRLGEFLRAYAIGKSQRIPKTSAFATIIVERLIDLLSLLTLLAATILFFPLPDEIKKGSYAIFFVAVTALVVLVLLMEKTDTTISVLQKILPSRLFQLVQKTVRSFLDGFKVFKKAEHYAGILITSILVWLLYAIVVFVTFYAFEMPEKYGVGLFSSLVVLVIVSIGIMIPSSPGFVGTYHLFCMKSLALFGVPQSEALSFAVISHGLNTIPFTIIGLIYFWKGNLHFSDAVKEKEIVEHGIEEEMLEEVD